jgi:hypothetical protein
MPYRAFISYSHETDAVTSAVQSALHRFAKPWYRLRALHVFRDETSLAANPGLASSLENAMRGCDYLLLVASPQSAQSTWVKWEIACWLKEHSVDRILILLADGEIVWNRDQHDLIGIAPPVFPRN